MKRNLLIVSAVLLGSSSFFAQTKQKDEKHAATYVAKAIDFEVTDELRDLPAVPNVWEDGKIPTVQNNLRRNKYVNDNALPKGNDPVWQQQKSSHYSKAPLQNWDGSTNFAWPPDPSGAAGPNHYIQMVNSEYIIYNKTGSVLYGPSTLGSLLGGGNDGDPIVMYDKDADRWFLSQFKSSNNSLQVAVSQTSDPLGSYYTYEFPLGSSFPDYPKYSVWGDGYYVTSNKSGDQCYVLERDQMLVGDPNAGIQGFTIPQLTTSGFFSALPANATSSLPTAGTPCYLFYFQDDGWGVSTDHVKIWEVDVDWATPTNSTISNPTSINVSPFDSEFTSNWDDIEQPGTSSRLDGIPGAFMYMAQYREFSGYSSVVLNHTVDVDGTNHAGIRWYEFRNTTGTWTLYQEGTFAPDNESRWLGSICMDYQGNIALAYSVSGPTVYPSIRYTGRYANDPLGQMTLTEEDIVVGAGVQTGANRWGDYAQMTIDPTDDATFWYTGEYVASGNTRKTRIASFKIANDFNDDIGVVSVDNPTDGVLSASESITVTLYNFGLNDQSNFPVSYTVNGGTVVNETYTGTLTANSTVQYTFTTTADMSTPGAYDIVAYTSLTGDQYNPNDTTMVTVNHLYGNDVGATAITAPVTGATTASESVTITVENFGTSSQSNFPVSYTINGGSPVTESYSGTLTAGASNSFTFTTTADLSALGTYSIVAYTGLSGDADNSNDTTSTTVDHEMCQPSGDCSFGDGFELFSLGTINNSTSCATGGYGDYTNMSTDLEQGSTNTLTIQSGYSGQTASVWIDFNDNFLFEASEMVVDNFSFGTSSATTDIVISSTADLGQHLMRAKTNWNSAGNATVDDPCADVTYGETEDYMVNIIAGSGVGVNEIYSNMNLSVRSLGNGKYSITITGINEVVSIKVHNTIGQKVFENKMVNVNDNFTFEIDLSENAEGYYLLNIGNENFNIVRKLIVE